jgi:hypothetical protein
MTDSFQMIELTLSDPARLMAAIEPKAGPRRNGPARYLREAAALTTDAIDGDDDGDGGDDASGANDDGGGNGDDGGGVASALPLSPAWYLPELPSQRRDC